MSTQSFGYDIYDMIYIYSKWKIHVVLRNIASSNHQPYNSVYPVVKGLINSTWLALIVGTIFLKLYQLKHNYSSMHKCDWSEISQLWQELIENLN